MKTVSQLMRKGITYSDTMNLKIVKDRLSNIFATCRTKVCNANKHCDLGFVCVCVCVCVFLNNIRGRRYYLSRGWDLMNNILC